MNGSLSPLASRALAVTILVAVVAGGWLGIGQPVLDRFAAYRQTIASAEERLPRLRRLAVMAPLLEAELARVRRDPSARARELSGASDALAAADLQAKVSRVAGGQQIALRSTQILTPVDEEGFRRIGIRVALEGSTSALHKILYGLETLPTLLFVDNLEIRSRSGGRLRRTREGTAIPEDKLSVRFDLYGYVGGSGS